MKSTAFWFLLTGASAALTHMGVFALVQYLQPELWPEAANALGFVVAFGVSFVGHRWLSFKGTSTPMKQSHAADAALRLVGFVGPVRGLGAGGGADLCAQSLLGFSALNPVASAAAWALKFFSGTDRCRAPSAHRA